MTKRYPYEDLTGRVFERITVLGEHSYNPQTRKRFWRCLCVCGKETKTTGPNLKRGLVKSCGCWIRDLRPSIKGNLRHGMTKTPEHKAWISMRKRCLEPTDGNYPLYGGRGIGVCKEWADSFEAFFADMGRKPSRAHSLDRIDNSKGYSPENCRWATYAEQNNNTRFNRHIEYMGRTLTVAQWSRVTGLSHGTILKRLENGWTVERTLVEPSHTVNGMLRSRPAPLC